MARTLMYMPLDALPDAPRNPRIHDTDTLGDSFDRFGYVDPVLLDERTGKLIEGHGRKHKLIDRRDAGRPAPDGIEVDDDGTWLVPVVRGWASADDAEAEALLIALNRITERSSWEPAGLASMLDSLAQRDGGLLGVGYEPADIGALLASLTQPEIGGSYRPQPMQEYAERYSIDHIVELAAQHYEREGFPYPSTPLHEKLWQVERLARVPFDDLAGTQIAHGVADEYHPHRWSVSVEGNSKPPTVAFATPKTLRAALKLGLEMNGNVTATALRSMLKFVRGGHQAAANFRPGFALRCMREFCPPGGVVLDTSTGFGGRLVGFAASACGMYIGIDPSTVTDAGNRKLADDLGISERVHLICKPAEDVTADELPAVADMAITSPPYFAKERYADEPTQSYVRYPNAEDWRDGFLRPMLTLQYKAVKPGGVSVVNIADVKIKGKLVPLVEWTIEAAADAGFVPEQTRLVYALGRVPGQGETQERHEPVLLFRRP